MHIVVLYSYAPDKSDLQLQLRPQHRDFLSKLAQTGLLRAAGAWTENPQGALLIFNSDDICTILEKLDADPYMSSGVIESRQAHQWNPPIGSL